MVDAARNHLSGRYARGLEKLLWEMERYPLPDLDAIRAVLAVVDSQEAATGPDFAAALVLVQAARLTVDRLEADVTEAARRVGVTWQQVADILDLPDSAAAGARQDEMLARRAEPNKEPTHYRLTHNPIKVPLKDES